MAVAGLAIGATGFCIALANLLLVRRRLGLWPWKRPAEGTGAWVRALRRIEGDADLWAPDEWHDPDRWRQAIAMKDEHYRRSAGKP